MKLVKNDDSLSQFSQKFLHIFWNNLYACVSMTSITANILLDFSYNNIDTVNQQNFKQQKKFNSIECQIPFSCTSYKLVIFIKQKNKIK